jgi:predicted metalloprotease with PDZ domain
MQSAEAAPIRIELDATQAPGGLLHSHMTIPATRGTLDLAYPKWIPGEHGPGGPLSQVVRLTFAANGKPLAWHRDDLDIFLFHVDVPAGVSQIEVDLDFACVLGQEGFQSDICTSYDQLVVNWWLVVLYPPNLPNDRDPFIAGIRLPAGWKYNTSLPSPRASAPNTIEFGEVPLKTLVDSPLIAGEHLRTFPLGGRSSALLAVSAESATSLAVPQDVVDHFRRMVAETEAQFGGPRYTKYNLQVSLGDAIDHYTLEHFESSENRLPSQGLSDSRVLLTTATMIPHEYIHSWNGKYRTPVGLDITTYQDPMKAGLIWVYEGLTDYISGLIAVRSGFWSEDQLRQSLAIDAAEMTYHTGRTWRSLQDTTIGAQMLLVSPNAWVSARRNTDFYPESGLMWLEADAIIRQSSGGHHSLDDFCRVFFGPHAPSTPYTMEDVVSALGQVAPYDWKSFLRAHLEARIHGSKVRIDHGHGTGSQGGSPLAGMADMELRRPAIFDWTTPPRRWHRARFRSRDEWIQCRHHAGHAGDPRQRSQVLSGRHRRGGPQNAGSGKARVAGGERSCRGVAWARLSRWAQVSASGTRPFQARSVALDGRAACGQMVG